MKRSGFTLIELMIVIIVIGVLAGMMYLSAGRADDSAKRAECLGEMEKIKTQYAMDEYGTDEDFKTRIAAVMGNVSQATADGAASDTQAKYKGLCASGGEYTITPGENSVKVECSIHGGEGGTVADSGTDSDSGEGSAGGNLTVTDSSGTKYVLTPSATSWEELCERAKNNNGTDAVAGTLYESSDGKYYIIGWNNWMSEDGSCTKFEVSTSTKIYSANDTEKSNSDTVWKEAISAGSLCSWNGKIYIAPYGANKYTFPPGGWIEVKS